MQSRRVQTIPSDAMYVYIYDLASESLKSAEMNISIYRPPNRWQLYIIYNNMYHDG